VDDEGPQSNQNGNIGSLTILLQTTWDGELISSEDFGDIKYTNSFGSELSIERLRFLISDLALTNSDGETILIDDYELVDVSQNDSGNLSLNLGIPTGNYEVSFNFGFSEEDNIDGVYPDLNVANWNVPGMLGGGYHYMQLEGKFIDETSTETAYQYHTIRAVDITGDDPVFEDTHIPVNLGNVNIGQDVLGLTIQMDVSEWFKNPNTWNLNELNSVLMPNFGAQKMMNENGQNVFKLGELLLTL